MGPSEAKKGPFWGLGGQKGSWEAQKGLFRWVFGGYLSLLGYIASYGLLSTPEHP